MINPQEKDQAKSIKIIEYNWDLNSPSFYVQAHDIIWEQFDGWSIYTPLTRNLARKYLPIYNIPENPYRHPHDIYLDFKGFDIIAKPLTRQLAWVLSAVNGDVERKRILDLGCGSTGETKDRGIQYQPWLCRALLELEAYPIGVDIGLLDQEKFEAHRIDLLTPDSLNFLPDGYVDVVHSRALFDSPELYKREIELPKSFSYKGDYFMEILRPQIERVLKPSGAFVYSKSV
ncbi:MAG: class I SAM-dependent methyltransferase [Candidatus Levybacteria bacterium]|nr:class I SAM-dependent methyltransferase [Candidatus Levybacteria bacterium]